MRSDGLFALRSGEVLLPGGQPATLEVLEVGQLRVPSGKLAVCDAMWLQHPNVLPVPRGDHRVAATIARVPAHYDYSESRAVSLSMVFSDQPSVSVHPAVFERDSLDMSEQPVGGIAGVRDLFGVGTSRFPTVAMVDAEAILPGMPSDPERWYDDVINPENGSGWFHGMDNDIDGPHGAYIGALPEARDGENIALLLARAHRLFPVLETRDAQGAITGIHIDLLVIGELSEKLGAFDGQSEDAAALAAEDAEDGAERREATRKESAGIRGLVTRLGKLFRR